MPPEPALDAPPPPEGVLPAEGGRAAARKGGRGGGKPVDFGTLDYLLRNFTLIYSTKTAWDARLQMVVPLDALAAAYPDLIRVWKSSPQRRMIDPAQLVFDPGLPPDAPHVINMFRGMPVHPVRGECGRLLELVNHLCGGDLDTIDWVLRWVAYPLQHPGAKMRTSIVMHGDPGAGKNLWWETVLGLFGEYGAVITQTQVEDRYNDWASRKLLVLADEVLTREELRHQKGLLKTYTTGSTIQIRAMYMSAREEANHMNMVFLSNETQPLAIDPGDRRYMVVWTPPAREPAFYDAVGAELRQGGAAALLWHLIHRVDCTGFDEHTKPPLNEAKADVIRLGMPTPAMFLADWREGMVPLPWQHCRSQDLYAAYLHWCKLQGERFPWSMTKFSREVERTCAKKRRLLHLPGDSANGQAVVFYVPDAPSAPPDGDPDSHWLGRLALDFRNAVESYAKTV